MTPDIISFLGRGSKFKSSNLIILKKPLRNLRASFFSPLFTADAMLLMSCKTSFSFKLHHKRRCFGHFPPPPLSSLGDDAIFSIYDLQMGEVVRLLPANDPNHALRLSAKKGYLGMVKALLADNRVNPGDKNYPFRKAAEKGHLEVVQTLIALERDRGVNPGAEDNYALERAALSGHVEVVKALLADDRVESEHDNEFWIGIATEE